MDRRWEGVFGGRLDGDGYFGGQETEQGGLGEGLEGEIGLLGGEEAGQPGLGGEDGFGGDEVTGDLDGQRGRHDDYIR